MDETIKNQPIEIISLQESDWTRVKELRLSALQQDPQAFGSNYQRELAYPDSLWIERHQDYLSGKSWLSCVEVYKQLIGMAGAIRNKDNPTVATVFGVYVDPKARGRSASKLMMSDLISKLQGAKGLDKVVLAVNSNQSAAINLYKSVGFGEVGQIESKMGNGNTYTEVEMELPLK